MIVRISWDMNDAVVVDACSLFLIVTPSRVLSIQAAHAVCSLLVCDSILAPPWSGGTVRGQPLSF